MLLKNIKKAFSFQKVKVLYHYNCEKGNDAILYKWFIVMLSFLSVLFFAFFAITPKPLNMMCLYLVFLIVLFVAGKVMEKKNTVYQWELNLWVSGFMFLCKLVFVCYFKQGAPKSISYIIMQQSILAFCFLVMLKMVGIIITVTKPEWKINKNLKKIINKIIYIVMAFSLIWLMSYRHTNDFLWNDMSKVSMAFNLSFSLIYYPWLIDIPFHLIYKEEIDAEFEQRQKELEKEFENMTVDGSDTRFT